MIFGDALRVHGVEVDGIVAKPVDEGKIVDIYYPSTNKDALMEILNKGREVVNYSHLLYVEKVFQQPRRVFVVNTNGETNEVINVYLVDDSDVVYHSDEFFRKIDFSCVMNKSGKSNGKSKDDNVIVRTWLSIFQTQNSIL